MVRAVFLDRDGVLNRVWLAPDGKPHPPSSVATLGILPGVVEACERLREFGFMLIVVTNQPDVARGHQTREAVETVNRELRKLVALDAVFTCYHDDAAGCHCRKPNPGLLQDAATTFGIALASSYMVGDRWRDIKAGRLAGCCTIQVGSGYGEAVVEEADFYAPSLAAAADWILGVSNPEPSVEGSDGSTVEA